MKNKILSIKKTGPTENQTGQATTDLFQIKIQICTLLAGALCVALCGCGTARVSARHEVGASPKSKPAMIYVSDFDLEASNVKWDRGLLPSLPKAPGPLGDMIPPLPGTSKDPEVVKRDVVNSMSVSMVKDLNKAGLTARRLAGGEPIPTSG